MNVKKILIFAGIVIIVALFGFILGRTLRFRTINADTAVELERLRAELATARAECDICREQARTAEERISESINIVRQSAISIESIKAAMAESNGDVEYLFRQLEQGQLVIRQEIIKLIRDNSELESKLREAESKLRGEQ